MNPDFDIVIPVGPKDIAQIKEQIRYTKLNILGYRNIYIISYDPTLQIEGCITIQETLFPFSMDTIVSIHGKKDRNGWYLQQLLKLYAGSVIPDIMEKYLIIDSDTYFLKPTTFVHQGKCLYAFGSENHRPYFNHMARLHSTLRKIDGSKSGICHHMIFEQQYIRELFKMIEDAHNNEPFYMTFLKQVDPGEITTSGASEYEIYFNYMMLYHPDNIQIRPLAWRNVNQSPNSTKYDSMDYVSYHWYMR